MQGRFKSYNAIRAMWQGCASGYRHVTVQPLYAEQSKLMGVPQLLEGKIRLPPYCHVETCIYSQVPVLLTGVLKRQLSIWQHDEQKCL